MNAARAQRRFYANDYFTCDIGGHPPKFNSTAQLIQRIPDAGHPSIPELKPLILVTAVERAPDLTSREIYISLPFDTLPVEYSLEPYSNASFGFKDTDNTVYGPISGTITIERIDDSDNTMIGRFEVTLDRATAIANTFEINGNFKVSRSLLQ